MDKIVTANLLGGIGNQLFQIALAYAVSKKYNRRFVFKKGRFNGCRQGNNPEKYYNTIYKKIPFEDFSMEHASVIDETIRNYYDFTKEIQNLLDKEIILFNGYFQTELYFKEYKEEIRQLFTPDEGIKQFLQNSPEKYFPELNNEHDYCFIGVRRGDYLQFPHIHNPCGMNYFNNAMALINKKRYYIASDDIEWCKKNFVGEQFFFFDIKDDLTQLYVMTLFKNYIISNSSYHWWGSFLSIYDNPIIVAPLFWVNGANEPYENYKDIYTHNMFRINRIVEIN